jgi:DNA-directed RNA polymerase subunit RPC12/RpoP
MSKLPRPGYQYHCSNEISVHCDRGTGKPRRAFCKYCGSRIIVREGYFGIFQWTGTGRYPLEKALKIYATERGAERARTGDLVVRFIST